MLNLHTIELEGRVAITTAQMKEVIGDFDDVADAIAEYCQCQSKGILKLYIKDKGAVVDYVPGSGDSDDEDGSVLYVKEFIPKGNPTLCNEDYFVNNALFSMFGEEDEEYMTTFGDLGVSPSDFSKIVHDYYFYNQYTLVEPLVQAEKHIMYLDKKGYSKLEGVLDYAALIDLLKESPKLSKENDGIYYLDVCTDSPTVIFAKFECVKMLGDYYFHTHYYKVDKSLGKTLVPSEEVNLIVDTMEMAILFNHLTDAVICGAQDKVADFGTSQTPVTVSQIVLYKQSELKDDVSVVYSTPKKLSKRSTAHSTQSVLEVTPITYLDDSSDFVVDVTLDVVKLLNEDEKAGVMRTLDLVDIFCKITNANKYHNRYNGFLALTPFNCEISLINTSNVQTIMGRDMEFCLIGREDILVDYIGEKEVSIWVLGKVDNSYYNIRFCEEDGFWCVEHCQSLQQFVDCTTKLVFPLVLDFDINYISISLVRYIHDLYFGYFNKR